MSCPRTFSNAGTAAEHQSFNSSSHFKLLHEPIQETIFNMPAPAHLISKVGDPIFALFIGLSAATTRISREEKEMGRTTQQTIDAGLRYFVLSLEMHPFLIKSHRRIGLRNKVETIEQK